MAKLAPALNDRRCCGARPPTIFCTPTRSSTPSCSLAPQHRLSFNAGASFANSAWNASYFGVTPGESARSGNRAYAPSGGIKDIGAGLRWNYALSPSWMLVSNLQATRLLGSAKNSPLAERPTNVTVSTALAYRF